jgi:hypothetical protein
MCSIIFMLGRDAHMNTYQVTLQILVVVSIIYLVLNATTPL